MGIALACTFQHQQVLKEAQGNYLEALSTHAVLAMWQQMVRRTILNVAGADGAKGNSAWGFAVLCYPTL
jgi:hypothetical protein